MKTPINEEDLKYTNEEESLKWTGEVGVSIK